MGFNTTAVILNDGLSSIRDNPNIGKEIADAVLSLSVQKPVRVPSGHIVLVETHHADGYVPILVGRNEGIPLNVAVHWSREQDAAEKELLRSLAAKHGYNLHRKRGR